MRIGPKIKRIREINEISTERVSSALNISESDYDRLENDELGINLEQLHQISLTLDVTIEQLITVDETLPMNQFHLNEQVIEAIRLSLNMKHLYAAKIALLEDKIRKLEKENRID